jgi:regulator of nonsense transcripts 1
VSLFDRLVQSGVPTFMLDTQYRMHPKIAEFASDAFYGGKVKNGVPESARPTIRGIQWPVEGNGVMLINTAHGQEASDGVSKSNQAEADIVSRIVADVLKAGEIGYNDIGIISPYSAQVRLLRQTLRWARDEAKQQTMHERQMYEQRWNMPGFGGGGTYNNNMPPPPTPKNLEISSVDGFQGREKALIIFSAVRANNNGSVGFLRDWRRCNVAITRAQRGLVVLGHAQTLQYDKRSFGPYLDYCLENGFIDGVEAKPGSYDKKATQAMAKVYDITANGNVEGLERNATTGQVGMEGGVVVPDGVMQAVNPRSDVL